MKTLRRLMTLSLAVLALGACDGSSTLPEPSGGQGAVRFGYVGALGGTFSVTGDAAAGAESWAAASEVDGYTGVTAKQVAADGSITQIRFAFPVTNAQQQTYRFDWSQCPADVSCPGGLIQFTTGGVTKTYLYHRGVIKVTASGGRVRGTFSGDAKADTGTGPLTLANGEFDVPVQQL